MHRHSWRLAAALALSTTAACRPEFKLNVFTTNEALYSASLQQYQHHHWDNAIAGFEKLTTDLSPRDSLLPRSYWFLASSHERNGENLLAAQSFSRLVETFPDDSLADDAALEAARSYKTMWRKPQLDATYGETALAQYNTLIGLYPTSPLLPQAQKEIGELEEWFARKDFAAGDYYFRRKAYDSGNLYFKDVLAKFPNTPTARRAALRLVQSYNAIRYKDDASELCTQLRQRYQKDREVLDVCRGVPDIGMPKPDSIPAPPVVKPPHRPRRPDRMRIGLLGGSFDPPHTGHLLAAGDAYDALALDRLVFIPAAIQPLKAAQSTAPAADRLEMVRRLIAGDARFEVDAVEIDRGGLSYTVDTLTALAARWPGAELFWLAGADVSRTFQKWREPAKIAALATLVVMQRAGETPDLGALPATTRVLETRRIDISSTEIRERVREGKSIRGFVPDAVAELIAAQRLYR